MCPENTENTEYLNRIPNPKYLTRVNVAKLASYLMLW